MVRIGAFGYWCRAVELAVKLLLIQAVKTGIWNARGEEKGKRCYQWTENEWKMVRVLLGGGRKKKKSQIIGHQRIELKGDRRGSEWRKKRRLWSNTEGEWKRQSKTKVKERKRSRKNAWKKERKRRNMKNKPMETQNRVKGSELATSGATANPPPPPPPRDIANCWEGWEDYIDKCQSLRFITERWGPERGWRGGDGGEEEQGEGEREEMPCIPLTGQRQPQREGRKRQKWERNTGNRGGGEGLGMD